MKKEFKFMTFIETYPMIMIVFGLCGISVSSILVRFSPAPSEVTAALRLLFTVFLMIPAVFGSKTFRKELKSVCKKDVILCSISGLMLAIHFTTWFESLKHTSVASSTTIVCTEVIWVALFYCLFMHGTISKKAICAIAVALLGSFLIAMADSSAGGTHLYGDILSVIAAISVAVYTLIGRAARSTLSTTIYTFIVYTACAISLVLFTIFNGNQLTGLDGRAYLVGLALALCSTIFGHSIFSWCLKYFSPAFIAATKLCEPVVAAILAVIIFAEIPDLLVIIGGAIILIGVIWYSRIEMGTEK